MNFFKKVISTMYFKTVTHCPQYFILKSTQLYYDVIIKERKASIIFIKLYPLRQENEYFRKHLIARLSAQIYLMYLC